ncbi:hypothetical protein ES703_77389 [subsurface metagenome]
MKERGPDYPGKDICLFVQTHPHYGGWDHIRIHHGWGIPDRLGCRANALINASISGTHNDDTAIKGVFLSTIGLYGEIVQGIAKVCEDSFVVSLFRKKSKLEITPVAEVTTSRGCFTNIDNRLVRAKPMSNPEALVFRVKRSICNEIFCHLSRYGWQKVG